MIDTIPGSWVNNTSTRRWIWETAAGTPVNVTRTFRTTFDLTGLDASTASLSGLWAADNAGLDIFINGAATGKYMRRVFKPVRLQNRFGLRVGRQYAGFPGAR